MMRIPTMLLAPLAAFAVIGMTSLTPTMAADIEPIVEEPLGANWTGFYLGAGGGFRWADFDVDTESCDDNVGECNWEGDDGIFAGYGGTFELYHTSLDDDGFFGTIQGGADYEFTPGFVAGVFASFDFGNDLEDSRFNNVLYVNEPDSGQFWSASIDNVITVAGRLGFAFDRGLFYGLIGWSWADAEVSHFEGCDFLLDGGGCGPDDLFANADDTIDGLTFGGGIEWLFTDHISGRLEYRHIEFDEVDLFVESGPYSAATSTDFDMDSVRATINWRF